MREAREIAGYRQNKAAKLIGIETQELNKIEWSIDVDAINLSLVVKAAGIYEVSIDFLLGTSPEGDWERDPNTQMLRDWGRQSTLFQLRQLAKMAIQVSNQQNQLEATKQAVSRIFDEHGELSHSISRFVELNQQFDDLPGGAAVVYHSHKLNEITQQAWLKLRRVKVLKAAPKTETEV
ncbi:helix-turn-helix transcriptional regulator [Methylotuvimicrobium sp. KM2]|uniref:helix-turn-helix domain-containing protein n=1 Tax=Methylotuvimicrobium sp. KM2 TaxID=3133976 RepID=UPI003100FEF3